MRAHREVDRAPRAGHRGGPGDGRLHRGMVPAWYTPREYDDRPETPTLDPVAPGPPATELALPIEGMTCASCVNRIERFLGKTPGVEAATVNLATETATIRYLPDITGRAELVGAIEAAGYDVRTRADRGDLPPVTLVEELSEGDLERARETRALLVRAIASIAVAIGIMVLMFAPGIPLSMEQRNSLAILPATFIQAWAGARFYRVAWRALRHGTTNMDTLVVAGTTAAWAYSVVLTLWPVIAMDAGPRARDLLRLVHADHRPRPARPVAGSAGQEPGDGRHPAAHRPPGDVRSRHPRRDRGGRAARGRPARRPPARPARREGPGRRRPRRGRLGGERVDADRRTHPGREGRRRDGHRVHPEHERHVRHAGHQGRPRHGPRPDRGPRPAGPGQQGAHPATGRRGQRPVRPARLRARGGRVRRLVRARPRSRSSPTR